MPELTADLPRKPCFRGFSSPPGLLRPGKTLLTPGGFSVPPARPAAGPLLTLQLPQHSFTQDRIQPGLVSFPRSLQPFQYIRIDTH